MFYSCCNVWRCRENFLRGRSSSFRVWSTFQHRLRVSCLTSACSSSHLWLLKAHTFRRTTVWSPDSWLTDWSAFSTSAHTDWETHTDLSLSRYCKWSIIHNFNLPTASLTPPHTYFPCLPSDAVCRKFSLSSNQMGWCHLLIVWERSLCGWCQNLSSPIRHINPTEADTFSVLMFECFIYHNSIQVVGKQRGHIYKI